MVRFTEGVQSICGGVRQPEVAPTHPAIRPVLDARVTAHQVDTEVGIGAVSRLPPQPAPSNATTIRELNNPFPDVPTTHITRLTSRRIVSTEWTCEADELRGLSINEAADRIEAKRMERERTQQDVTGRELQLPAPFERDPHRHDTGRAVPERGL